MYVVFFFKGANWGRFFCGLFEMSAVEETQDGCRRPLIILYRSSPEGNKTRGEQEPSASASEEFPQPLANNALGTARLLDKLHLNSDRETKYLKLRRDRRFPRSFRRTTAAVATSIPPPTTDDILLPYQDTIRWESHYTGGVLLSSPQHSVAQCHRGNYRAVFMAKGGGEGIQDLTHTNPPPSTAVRFAQPVIELIGFLYLLIN